MILDITEIDNLTYYKYVPTCVHYTHTKKLSTYYDVPGRNLFDLSLLSRKFEFGMQFLPLDRMVKIKYYIMKGDITGIITLLFNI